MAGRDEYYNRAKQEGYRARSAYKLQQIDAAEDVLSHGDTVVDLGAAPGGWLQVAAEAVGESGLVVGVDRQRIDPLESDVIETVRGDMTEERTRERLRAALGVASAQPNDSRERSQLGSASQLAASSELSTETDEDGEVERDSDDGVEGDSDDGVEGDSDGEVAERRTGEHERGGDERDTATVSTPERHERPADVVVSDMAPNVTGEYQLDHARSIHLARQAFETALTVLRPGGDFVVKVFDGRELSSFRSEVEDAFEYVRSLDPDASREESSERYLIGKHHVDAPVAAGERREVEIVDVGDDGDGVASVDGYTLFVPGTEPGETVSVRITDVKARFGFAQRID